LSGAPPPSLEATVPRPSVLGPAAPSCATRDRLAAWQAEIDGFDGGFRPTGSLAHEGYIALLAEELAAEGVAEVHSEPYPFRRWTPSSWSLAWDGRPVAVSGYVPYSGSTGARGVTAPVVRVPATPLLFDAAAIGEALRAPGAWASLISAGVGRTIALLELGGKIALVDVPRAEVSLSTLSGPRLYANDPTGALPPDRVLARNDLAAMSFVPGALEALAAAGAVGAVFILDAPEEAARAAYAPFFGAVSPNLPALYVDRASGAALRTAASVEGPLARATLILDATTADAVSENLIGILPGASAEEIVLGSHTDGPNSIEDNGPAAILALASCLGAAPRPRTVRFVLSGGHFIGSRGLDAYVAQHLAELTARARAVIEIEHLGARAWTEVRPGTMGLTGEPEVQLVTTWPSAPLVAASIEYARRFPRTIVGTPPLLGEGPNFRVVPLIQIIALPEYLLLGHLPAITTEFTDYDLMRREVDAILELERTLARAP
jgi:hypothetical protein